MEWQLTMDLSIVSSDKETVELKVLTIIKHGSTLGDVLPRIKTWHARTINGDLITDPVETDSYVMRNLDGSKLNIINYFENKKSKNYEIKNVKCGNVIRRKF